MRIDKRKNDSLRDVSIEMNVNRYAEGSCLIKYGHTHVLCTASVDTNLPKWMQGQQKGWVSAEYGMIPRSTNERMNREKIFSSGRTQEISRLIARSLRSCIDLYELGEVQINVDCDVIQADGGTRTAAITGGFLALTQAAHYLYLKNEKKSFPIKHALAAVSVGLFEGNPLLDLCYLEDMDAETDANFVMNEKKEFVEIQGTAEEKFFNRQQLTQMMDLAEKGCLELIQKQKDILEKLNIAKLIPNL